jgi:Adenylate cyclase associated (CAP) N terminal
MTANTNMHNLTTLIKRYDWILPDRRYHAPAYHVIPMERPIAASRSMLTTIYNRLEAATSRLEDMATSIDSSHPSTVAAISNSAVAPPNSSKTSASTAVHSADRLPPSIKDFDRIVDQDVNSFVTASEKVGGLVEQQV